MATTLTKKQKVLLPIVILLFIVLGWQLFSGGDDDYSVPDTPPQASAPAKPTVQQNVAIKHESQTQTNGADQSPAALASPGNLGQAAQGPATPGATPAGQMGPQAGPAPSKQKPMVQKAAVTDLLKSRQASNQDGQDVASHYKQLLRSIPGAHAQQQQYLQMLNQLQMIQIQKMLAQARAATAQANLTAAKSQADAKKLMNQSRGTQTVDGIPISSDQAAATARKVQEALSNAKVLLVRFKNGNWTATMSYNGKLRNVQEGDIFPDGTTVKAIDRNGVVIHQFGADHYVTISVPYVSSTAVKTKK